MALLGLIVLLCTSAIGLLRQALPQKTVVYKTTVEPTPPPVKEEAEETEDDETVPIEQFTPEFNNPSKPLKVKYE